MTSRPGQEHGLTPTSSVGTVGGERSVLAGRWISVRCMPQTVLITGAFGLVGPETVRRFAADGWHVVATAHRNVDAVLPPGVETRWVDVTDPEQVERLVSEVAPDAIVHLAAVIPPWIYRDPGLGRKVNVDATAMLVRAAEAQPNPPRFLHASSAAVYGSRNPYRHPEPVGVD